MTRNLILIGLATSLAATVAHAQSGSMSVSAQTNIFLAGGNVPGSGGGGPGSAPAPIALFGGGILTVSATGSATFCAGGTCLTATPDGPASGGTNISPATGTIAGILAPTSGFLAGVFLADALPGSRPAALDFNALTTTFSSLSPLLGQVFFVGDGSNGTTSQQFVVPTGATTLYFGVADGFGFSGGVGYFEDNAGSYQANYSIAATTVPEPSTFLLSSVGIAAVCGIARRRRAAAPNG